MSDELKPALDALDWESVTHDAKSWLCQTGSEPYNLSRDVRDDELPGILAAANYALPDDSPYKITREDVSQLMELAEEPEDFERARWLAPRLAAKLAALLPPDTR